MVPSLSWPAVHCQAPSGMETLTRQVQTLTHTCSVRSVPGPRPAGLWTHAPCAVVGDMEVSLPFPQACCLSSRVGNILETLRTQKLVAGIIVAVCCNSVVSIQGRLSPWRAFGKVCRHFLVVSPAGQMRPWRLLASYLTKDNPCPQLEFHGPKGQ